MPVGIKLSKLAVQFGLLCMLQKPAPNRAKMVPSWTIVTILPVLPVSEVPFMLIYMNAMMDATAIILSNGITPSKG